MTAQNNVGLLATLLLLLAVVSVRAKFNEQLGFDTAGKVKVTVERGTMPDPAEAGNFGSADTGDSPKDPAVFVKVKTSASDFVQQTPSKTGQAPDWNAALPEEYTVNDVTVDSMKAELWYDDVYFDGALGTALFPLNNVDGKQLEPEKSACQSKVVQDAKGSTKPTIKLCFVFKPFTKPPADAPPASKATEDRKLQSELDTMSDDAPASKINVQVGANAKVGDKEPSKITLSESHSGSASSPTTTGGESPSAGTGSGDPRPVIETPSGEALGGAHPVEHSSDPNDPLYFMPAEMKADGEAALQALLKPVKCDVCRCMMNEMIDQETLRVGNPADTDEAELGRVAEVVLKGICLIFGPRPYEDFCDDVTGTFYKDIIDGLKATKKPEELCTQFKACDASLLEKRKEIIKKSAAEKKKLKPLLEGVTGAVVDERNTGMAAIVRNVFFVVDKWEVTDDGKAMLKALAEVIKKNPPPKIQVEGKEAVYPDVIITGYTDNEMEADKNLYLSEQRAASVMAELEANGVKPDRLKHRGKGEATPIAPNDTPDGKDRNRRVEVLLVTRPPRPELDEAILPKSKSALDEAAQAQDKALSKLGQQMDAVIEPLKCPTCKCLVGFIYDKLYEQKEDQRMVKPTADAVSTAFLEVCNEVNHAPFDIFCDALDESQDVVVSMIQLEKPVAAVCAKLSLCAGDGLSEGPASIDAQIDKKKEEIHALSVDAESAAETLPTANPNASKDKAELSLPAAMTGGGDGHYDDPDAPKRNPLKVDVYHNDGVTKEGEDVESQEKGEEKETSDGQCKCVCGKGEKKNTCQCACEADEAEGCSADGPPCEKEPTEPEPEGEEFQIEAYPFSWRKRDW